MPPWPHGVLELPPPECGTSYTLSVKFPLQASRRLSRELIVSWIFEISRFPSMLECQVKSVSFSSSFPFSQPMAFSPL